MSLSLRQKSEGGNWYVRGSLVVWRDGKSARIPIPEQSTGTDCRNEAEAIRDQIVASARQRHFIGGEPERTFAQVLEAYLDGGGQARYLDRIERRLGGYPVSAITREIVNKEGARAHPKVADSTMRRQWHGPIIAALNAAGVAHSLKRPSAGKSRVHFLRPEQAERIIQEVSAGRYANPWAPALVTFWLGTGARLSESLLLETQDVHLDYGMAILRDTKNGAERTVTLPPRVVAALSTLPNINTAGRVFRKANGKPYTVRKDTGTHLAFLTSAVKRAKLEPHVWTPHAMRHSFATWHYAALRDLLELQHRGGWSSLRMVEVYTHLATPRLAADLLKHNWVFSRLDAPEELGMARESGVTHAAQMVERQ